MPIGVHVLVKARFVLERTLVLPEAVFHGIISAHEHAAPGYRFSRFPFPFLLVGVSPRVTNGDLESANLDGLLAKEQFKTFEILHCRSRLFSAGRRRSDG